MTINYYLSLTITSIKYCLVYIHVLSAVSISIAHLKSNRFESTSIEGGWRVLDCQCMLQVAYSSAGLHPVQVLNSTRVSSCEPFYSIHLRALLEYCARKCLSIEGGC